MATAALFVIAMFLAPVAQLIPTYACAARAGLRRRTDDEQRPQHRMGRSCCRCRRLPDCRHHALTYNISYGIAFGLISYIFIKLFTGMPKEINAGTWIIGILFGLMFFLTH